ncbi:DUF5667 domain-containing protein [Bacillota bacterium Lsc_1132]
MKKFIINKELAKIAKGTLAVVLAGTFTFSASKAFAEEPTDKTPTVSAAAGTNNTAATTVAPLNESKETPSLLPGDFFYFAKLALEKIKLALAFDKVKDAQLLAGYASERLAEAEALFNAGKQDEAVNAMKAAMEDMNQADQMIKDEKEPSSSTVNAETEDANKEEVQVTNGQSNADNAEQEKAKDQTASKNTQDDQVKQVQEVLSKNIAALTAAMEKVKNPTARAALQKNIDKSYAKLAEKIKKYEEKLAKITRKDEQREVTGAETAANNPTEVSSETNVDTEVKAAPETAVKSADVQAAVSQSGEIKAPVSTTKNLQTKAKVEAETKPVPSVVKQDRQQVKQKIKQEVKQEINQTAKQEIKQIPKDVNEQLKQNKAEVNLFEKE